MKRRLFALIVATSFASSAISADHFIRSESPGHQHAYFVSGVLKKNAEGTTIKLVHSVERASSEETALVAFVKKAATQYPDYRMLDAIVSPGDETVASPDRYIPGLIAI